MIRSVLNKGRHVTVGGSQRSVFVFLARTERRPARLEIKRSFRAVLLENGTENVPTENDRSVPCSTEVGLGIRDGTENGTESSKERTLARG